VGGITGSLVGATGAGNQITLSGSLTNSGEIDGTSNTGGLFCLTQYVIFSQDSSHSLTNTGGLVNSTSGNDVGGLIGQVGTATVFTPAGAVSTSGTTVNGAGNNIGGLFGEVTSDAGTFNPALGLSNAGNVTMTGSGTGVGGIFGSFNKTAVTLGFDMSNSGIISGVNATSGVGGITGSLVGGSRP